MTTRRLIIGISGASGVIYGIRMLQKLRDSDIETHLVVSKSAQVTLAYETHMTVADVFALAHTTYKQADIGAAISSGSFQTMGMVIAPCSMRTLGEIATSVSSSLLTRAADVVLKERRRLVIAHREMPLSPIDVNNYKALTDAGAILAPANPGFYLNPATVDEVVDFVAGKLLDLVGVPHGFDTRWDPKAVRPPAARREIV